MIPRYGGIYLVQFFGGNKGDLWVVSGEESRWDYREENLFHMVSFCISDFNMDS